MPHAMIDTYAARLEEALPLVRERIRRAVDLAGRPAGVVRLVAVTKSHPLAALEAALAAGLRDLGENRVEELEEKVRALGGAGGPTWHLIGHVQSRKARRAMELADLVHSVDSARLGEKMARLAAEEGRTVAVLAQVNTSGEESKSGFAAEEAVERIHELAESPGVDVRGLMTMAPLVDDEAVLAGTFGRLREIHERLRGITDDVGPELSMGMTNDLEIAIREGSTMVRIGTALFGERAR